MIEVYSHFILILYSFGQTLCILKVSSELLRNTCCAVDTHMLCDLK